MSKAVPVTEPLVANNKSALWLIDDSNAGAYLTIPKLAAFQGAGLFRNLIMHRGNGNGSLYKVVLL